MTAGTTRPTRGRVTAHVVKSRRYGVALVRVVLAVAAFVGAWRWLPSPAGAYYLCGCCLLGIGVTLLVAPAFRKATP